MDETYWLVLRRPKGVGFNPTGIELWAEVDRSLFHQVQDVFRAVRAQRRRGDGSVAT